MKKTCYDAFAKTEVTMKYCIASCVFTSRHPELSRKILDYIQERGDLEIIRCCVMHYREKDFTDMMPESFRDFWASLPSGAEFMPGDIVYSLCHNCTAIIDEWKEGVETRSLWEYIDRDPSFVFPDFRNEEMYVQDCWRAYDKKEEQLAVRSLMKKMNIAVLETENNFEHTDFCGNSLYRPAPPRNLKLAPKRFVENAQGLFKEHTSEEQKALMKSYAAKFNGKKVVSYCHYCEEGLLLGEADACHIAQLLFEKENRV